MSAQPASRHIPPARPFSPRQKQILDALERLFVEDGLRLSVREIAARVNCSRRTLYELAPSKEELFRLALDRMMRRLGYDARRAAKSAATPEAQLLAFVEAALPVFRPLSPKFMDALDADQAARWLFDYHMSIAGEFAAQIIRDGIDTGRFHDVDPEFAWEVAFGAIRRMTEPEILQARGLSADEALAQVFAVITRGLLKHEP
jgi:AcrR family transcriptional regulator